MGESNLSIDEKKVTENQVIPESFFSENGWKFSLNYGGLKVYKKDNTNVIWNPEKTRVVLVYTDEEARNKLEKKST